MQIVFQHSSTFKSKEPQFANETFEVHLGNADVSDDVKLKDIKAAIKETGHESVISRATLIKMKRGGIGRQHDDVFGISINITDIDEAMIIAEDIMEQIVQMS